MIKKSIILVFIGLLSITSAFSQTEKKIELTDLIKDLQQIKQTEDEISLVWWIPVEYWEIALRNGGTLSEKEIDEFVETLQDYEIFAIAKGSVNILGRIEFYHDSIIRKSLLVVDSAENQYIPIEESSISFESKYTIEMMKPMFRNILGEFGSNINFYYFEMKDRKNNRIIDPKGNVDFTVSFASEKFEWDLPIGLLLPTKYCPVCKKEMNGKWNYCPIHGEKLLTEKEFKKSENK